jgi:hypothetical protein
MDVEPLCWPEKGHQMQSGSGRYPKDAKSSNNNSLKKMLKQKA